MIYNKGYDIYIDYNNNNNELPKIYYKGKLLKPYLKRSNTHLQYPIVRIPNHGENYVHLIIAFSYLNYKDKIKLSKYGRVVVDHIDGNTLNYKPENLRYLLHKDNIKLNNGYMKRD